MRRRATIVVAFALAAALVVVVGASSALACVALASLDVTPYVVQPGQEVEFSGSYYHEAAPVVLRWGATDGPVVATVPVEALVDFRHGHWRNMSGRFTVPADAAAGSHLVVATQDASPGRPVWGVPSRAVIQVGAAAGAAPAAPAAPAPEGSAGAGLVRLRQLEFAGNRDMELLPLALVGVGAAAFTVLMALVIGQARVGHRRRSSAE